MTTPPTVEYRTIELTQGQIAFVSPRVYEKYTPFKWCAYWNPYTRSYYAARRGLHADGKRHNIYLHREILGLDFGDPRFGDHDNHNTLDNTDINLRIAPSKAEQSYNMHKHRDGTSGYKGVTFDKATGMWKAQIGVHGVNHHLGRYATAYEAYLAYCYAAVFYFGEFACLE